MQSVIHNERVHRTVSLPIARQEEETKDQLNERIDDIKLGDLSLHQNSDEN
jgi:hypothetical protein